MERRQTDPSAAALGIQMGAVQESLRSVHSTMREMSAAITRLAVMEERLGTALATQDRTFKMISEMRQEHAEAMRLEHESKKKLSERIGALEVDMPIKNLMQKMFFAAMGGIVVAVFASAWKLIQFIK